MSFEDRTICLKQVYIHNVSFYGFVIVGTNSKWFPYLLRYHFLFANSNISLWCTCLSFSVALLPFFQGKFHGNPMHVAVVISNCLREERRILAAANMPVQVRFSEPVILLSLRAQFSWTKNLFLRTSFISVSVMPPSFRSRVIKTQGSLRLRSFSPLLIEIITKLSVH